MTRLELKAKLQAHLDADENTLTSDERGSIQSAIDDDVGLQRAVKEANKYCNEMLRKRGK